MNRYHEQKFFERRIPEHFQYSYFIEICIKVNRNLTGSSTIIFIHASFLYSSALELAASIINFYLFLKHIHRVSSLVYSGPSVSDLLDQRSIPIESSRIFAW